MALWQGSLMNATEYKTYHESLMANNHGTSALHTFFSIFFTVKCSLYVCLIPRRKTGLPQYFFEYVTIVVPMIATNTVLHKYLRYNNLFSSAFLLYEFVHHYPRLEISKTFSQPNTYPTRHILSISCLRALTYLITVFAILAVDFKSFPRSKAKTERFGYSFMDTGVGLFVLMSGLVHKELRKGNLGAILKSNAKFITVLTILGVARFWSVKALDYQEHVTEYGVHWNFFFTLAMCKLTSTILLAISKRPLQFAIITIVIHEYLLYYSLQKWVFSDTPRIDLLSANREGISSCLGYTALYLFAVYVKNVISNPKSLRYMVIVNLVLVATFLWLLLYFVNHFRPISRTLANLGYCAYLSAFLVTTLTIMYFFEVLFQNKEKRLSFELPLILSAVNQNGLIYFLAANLVTGAVNLSMQTLFVPTAITFVILNVYMILTLALVIFLKNKGIQI